MDNFDLSMIDIERSTWKSFAEVTKNFIENTKSANQIGLVESLLAKLHNIVTNMSMTHYKYEYDSFPDHLEIPLRFKIYDGRLLLEASTQQL